MDKEWLNEPQNKEFSAFGYECEIKRHSSLLHLCGYVKIPKQHKLFNIEYSELYDKGIDINIHGGLTFSHSQGNMWVFGFDCAHLGDLVPSMLKYEIHQKSGEIYRNMEYVEKETKSLAKQLKELE